MYSVLIAIGLLLNLLSSDTVLLEEHFSYANGKLPAHFWSEGCPSVIRNGKLFIDADTVGPRASSVWLDKQLSGDMSIEFDVYLVSSADDSNNINLFLMYSDTSGKHLKQTSLQRKEGLYKSYHELQGYIFTNVTNGDTADIRYRFRENPGFRLVQQHQMKRNARTDKIHIKIIKKNNHLQYWENGDKIFDKAYSATDKQYNAGLLGFRTWHTAMEIDDLLIKKI